MPVSSEAIAEIVGKRTNMFGSLTPYLHQLFTDSKARSLPRDEGEQKKELQLFARSVREELKVYFQQRGDKDWLQKGTQGWKEVESFVSDFPERRSIHLSQYMELCSTIFPILSEVYQNEICCPASTAAVERSFSIQGYYMSCKRASMSPATIRATMILRMNTVLGIRDGWRDEMESYIEKRTAIANKKK